MIMLRHAAEAVSYTICTVVCALPLRVIPLSCMHPSDPP
jgi:hypothetical protein